MALTKSSQSTVINAQAIGSDSNYTSTAFALSDAFGVSFDCYLDYTTNPTSGSVTIKILGSQDGTNASDEAYATAVTTPTADRRIVFQCECYAMTHVYVKIENGTDQSVTATVKAVTASI
jgi:hypothetical protein